MTRDTRRPRSLPRILPLITSVFCAATLTACGAERAPPALLPHPMPAVSVSADGTVIAFASDAAELSATEARRLEAFLRSMPTTARVRYTLTGHADDRASEAYNLELAAARAQAVASTLQRLGVADIDIAVRALGETAPRASGDSAEARALNRRVEVFARIYDLSPTSCRPWEGAGPGLPDFGCATAANLARMIADPLDLEQGTELGPADGIAQAEAVARYRANKVTPLDERSDQP
jgi:pilus biogenesis lipoprotein CpaD